MDYLLSLNAEQVKIQEKEIIDIHKELDESKEEIHYLNNKLNQKYDIIEDMGNDLENIEEKY